MSNHNRSFSESAGGQPASTNALLVIISILLASALAYQTWSGGRQESALPTVRPITPRGELEADEKSTIAVFQQASPSVVFIRTKGYSRVLFGGIQEAELSSGTGFVWDTHGHIVTNLHVIEAARRTDGAELEVQFADQTVVDAEIVGGVREHDIAVLKVNTAPERLKAIALGTSDDLRVGQQVLAIGSPFGFDQTLSTGVIGGLNRSVPRGNDSGLLDGLIQTDAAINPGNSGGPLLDSAGRLIGVNTAIVSPTGAYSGLGFAVPVNSIVASVEMVLNASIGKIPPVLGITVLTQQQAEYLGVPQVIARRGLFIKEIHPNSPAAAAGLESMTQNGYRILLRDQISGIDGKAVTSQESLKEILGNYSPGDVVTVQIYRGDRRGEVQIRLQARELIF